MKTLDEVIDIMDGIDQTCTCCAYQHDCDETECIEKDALHYLKMYRSDQIEWDANRKAWDLVEEELVSSRMKYIAKLKELDIGTLNNPLTWDELRQMEGKPVWMEWTKTEESYWCIVGEWFDDDELRIYMTGKDYADYIHKTIYSPDIVQAYRKERE